MAHGEGIRPTKKNGWVGLKIMALDPGGTTGWCMHTVVGRGFTLTGEALRFQGGQMGPHEHHKELWNFLIKHAPDIIVCESFDYRIVEHQGAKMPGIVLISRDYIGVAKLYAQSTKDNYFEQKPADVKPLWTDDKLKALGVYTKGAPHRNDATRHMLHFVVQTLDRKDYLNPLRPA